jgi:hypothetical protein
MCPQDRGLLLKGGRITSGLLKSCPSEYMSDEAVTICFRRSGAPANSTARLYVLVQIGPVQAGPVADTDTWGNSKIRCHSLLYTVPIYPEKHLLASSRIGNLVVLSFRLTGL